MTEKKFIDLYKEIGKFETKKEAEEKLEAFLTTVELILKKKGEVSFLGFGKFEVVDREGKEDRHPQTGKVLIIPSKKAIEFKPGLALIAKINR